MQYLHNQWFDFKNSWSCLILTLLWIETITMKITIFHMAIFWQHPNNDNEWPVGHRTHKTLILLIIMSGELCLNDILTETKYHWWAEESLANNMGWSVTELFVKRFRACVMGADTLNTSWNKLFLHGFEPLASCDSLKCQISMFSLISIQALWWKL